MSSPPSADEENCYIETPVGVAAVLRSVAAARARAVVYLDEGDTFLHTSILGLDRGDFVFEKGADAMLNARILSTAEMTLVTSDREVPVQFRFKTPKVMRFEDADVLRAPLPVRLLRLQRRGFYRLPGASINALMKCEIVRGDDARKVLRPAVIDISCGGMAIDIPTADGLLDDDTRHTCTIDFVGLGRIDTPLIVHSSREVTLANGSPGRRYGIEFLNLEVKSVAIIQRFINDEERRLIRGSRK
jgi:c-di-GMP-binding flagellar brake protein YcgR